MEIIIVSDNERESWDKYVRRSEKAPFFHQFGWGEVIEKTFHHKPIYLAAKQNGKIVGILPTFLIKSLFFGKYLISLPFGGAYAGVCGNSQEIEEKLVAEAVRLTKEMELDYLLLRHVEKKELKDFYSDNSYVNSIVELASDPEVIHTKLKDDIKWRIRKAERQHLILDLGIAYLKDFYKVWSISMRDHGTPVYPYNFFTSILREFPDDFNVAIVKYRGKIISAATLVSFKDTLIGIFAGSLKKYGEYSPNHLLYWGVIKYGCENGYKHFNISKSRKGTGSHLFKLRWGARDQQLFYHYYLNKAGKIPQLDPQNPKFRLYAEIWKRVPLPVANLTGPKLIRHIP